MFYVTRPVVYNGFNSGKFELQFKSVGDCVFLGGGGVLMVVDIPDTSISSYLTLRVQKTNMSFTRSLIDRQGGDRL